MTKLGVLLLIFILGVIGFSSFMNKETTENKMDMEEASLPVLSMMYEGQEMNRMYGYAQEMQVDFMRDSLTPVGTDKKMTVSILPYDHKIKTLSMRSGPRTAAKWWKMPRSRTLRRTAVRRLPRLPWRIPF
ncbi:hypothetical protein LC724_26160 [Blautia sp. RD014234]|nr:hypothetical protein [Blautia parvula]